MASVLFSNTHSISLQAKARQYLAICKIKVVVMLVITAWVGQALAPQMDRSLIAQLMSLLGIGLLSCAAAAINHIADREIDKKMARTRHRPLAQSQLTVRQAIYFALVLMSLGITCLLIWANVLCALLTTFALVGYAFIYTVFLKRATPQNIVIGGLAGALPPLLGWVSETGHMDMQAWLLVMIIFIWTPPHFWALAIARRRDYQRANIPMLPVTHGCELTRVYIVIYSVLLCLVCLLPYLTTMSGEAYLAFALVFKYYLLN